MDLVRKSLDMKQKYAADLDHESHQNERAHSMSVSIQQNTETGDAFQSFEYRLLLIFGNILIVLRVLLILRCMKFTNFPITFC